jgi:hypothetical protein
MEPAKVQKGRGYNTSSDDEPFDPLHAFPTMRNNGSRTRLADLANTIEVSRPHSPKNGPQVSFFSKRLSSESIAAAHALVGLIRQAELRVLAKAVRTWLLKPIRVRTEAFSSRIRHLEKQIDKAAAAAHMGGILLRTITIRGQTEFITRLKLVANDTESDAEWESAAEHIQKLRDLLAMNILTNVVDKWEIRTIASIFFELRRLPEFIS